jgi:hypothetical protein
LIRQNGHPPQLVDSTPAFCKMRKHEPWVTHNQSSVFDLAMQRSSMVILWHDLFYPKDLIGATCGTDKSVDQPGKG